MTQDQARVLYSMEEVDAYFRKMQPRTSDAFLPRAEWVLYWLSQRKTPAEIYAIAMNREHLTHEQAEHGWGWGH